MTRTAAGDEVGNIVLLAQELAMPTLRLQGIVFFRPGDHTTCADFEGSFRDMIDVSSEEATPPLLAIDLFNNIGPGDECPCGLTTLIGSRRR